MGIPICVLIVEDSEDDAALLQRELRRGGYETVAKRVETAKAMSAELKRQDWDIIISDYVLPRFSGLEALNVLKGTGLDLPFIIISGKIGEDTAVEAMRAGAHDYIMKERLTRLIPAIQRELKEAKIRGERRLAEEALRKQAQIIDQIHDSVVSTDLDGNVTSWNKGAERLFGYSDKEALGKHISFVYPEDQHQFLEQEVIKPLKEKGDHEIEVRMRRKSGEDFYAHLALSLLKSTDGSVIGMIGYSMDITERKRAEEMLRQTTGQLEIEREALERKNVALREILDQIDAEKNAVKQQIAANVEQAIIPTLLRLKESSHPSQSRIFEMLERDLKEIASPFLDTLKSEYAKLSPRELEVCRLIKNGLTSKEIAEALSLSVTTIHKYRELIRKKLGLVNNEVNLHTYLQSL
ncbi:MAG: PAS domain S-box protein [Candidatus Zixiibacteriota bacterium]|nr:MAG: PAS domain S-box protein [candidate division Zixibacteria bacterium]